MIIKICGITTLDVALAAQEYGADFVGLVFAPSRRQVSLETAAAISRRLTDVKKVGVFVNAPLDTVQQAIETCGLDLVQLHGEESADYCRNIARPVIRAVKIGPEISSVLPGKEAQWLLFDTAIAGECGGTGQSFSWKEQVELRRRARQPVLLAGGLNAENVGAAIQALEPDGVDVSSGVETAGKKDLLKIKRFIEAVRGQGG